MSKLGLEHYDSSYFSGRKDDMEVRQLCSPRSASVFREDGEKFLTISLPSQPMGYDVKKNEGHWYQIDFLFVPDAASEATEPVKGNVAIREFCGVEHAIADLDRKSSKYLSDDAALSVREPVKGFENSTITLFYRDSQPWFHLKFLGVELEEAVWVPGMFNSLRQLAEEYQAERDAFEAKMKVKVEHVGKSED